MKRVICGIALILLLIGMLASVKIHSVRAESRTWTVDDDGAADFHTIQEAINTANIGDNIFVKNGIYYGNVIIDKTLSLTGQDRDSVTIDSDGTDIIVEIGADRVRFQNFTLRNSNVITLVRGFDVLGSNNILNANRLERGRWGCCINVAGSNNTIANSIISVDDYADYGVYLHGSNNYVHNNIFSARAFGSIGIAIQGKENVVVDNEISVTMHCTAGVQILGSQNNVSYNWIGGSGWYHWFIGVSQGSCNIIHNNSLKGSSYSPPDFFDSSILLEFGSFGNIVSGNSIENTHGRGISLMLSTGNVIFNNIIANTAYCIQFYNSSNNEIFHNSFMKKSSQVYTSYSVDLWDDGYPSGGNYWSDYIGADLFRGSNQDKHGSDGIGDTPYVIDNDNIDHYPLINPWTPTETTITVKGEDYPVTIVSNTTLEQIIATSNTLHFKSSGPTGDTGYVNVIFPMVNTTDIKVFIDGQKLTPPPFPVINSNGTHYFIYFEFTLSAHDIAIQFAPLSSPTPPVGGEWIPIDRLQLLAPWISLVSLMTAVTASFVYVRRKKKQD